MSKIKFVKTSTQKTASKLKTFKRNQKTEKNRLGKLTFIVTAMLVVAGVLISGGFSSESESLSVDPPLEAININAFSSSWSCPMAGNPQEGDSILLANADPSRSAQVKIVAHGSDGEVLGREDVDVEASSSREIALSEITDQTGASLYVESFAGSIVPIRALNLSDGLEFIRCVSANLVGNYFLGVQTLRDTSAQLVLSNPYPQAVVVDISAYLTDTTVDPPRSTMSETRGIIISGRGRTTIDLQKEYGRYSQVNLKAIARSGFFAGEVFQTFDGNDDIFGQTVISSSSVLNPGVKSFIPGAEPNLMSGFNNENATQSVTLEAYSTDNRFITLEPQSVLASSSRNFEVPGLEFRPRMITALVEGENENENTNVYGSWLRKVNNSVSSGDLSNSSSRAFLLPVRGQDLIFLYNPNNSKATLEINYSVDLEPTELEIEPQEFKVVPVAFDNTEASIILTLVSDRKIFAASGNERQSRYYYGINLTR